MFTKNNCFFHSLYEAYQWSSHSSNKENLAQFKIGLNCTFDWAGFAPKTYAVGTLLNNLNTCINECIPDIILMQKIAKLLQEDQDGPISLT